MRELHIRHVERHGLGPFCRMHPKNKPRPRVNELSDEPGGACAVDARSWPREPNLAGKSTRICFADGIPDNPASQRFLYPAQHHLGVMRAGGVKVIHGTNLLEPPQMLS